MTGHTNFVSEKKKLKKEKFHHDLPFVFIIIVLAE